MLAQLYEQRERAAAQVLRQESVSRGDLEAVVARIEHHFKVRTIPAGRWRGGGVRTMARRLEWRWLHVLTRIGQCLQVSTGHQHRPNVTTCNFPHTVGYHI